MSHLVLTISDDQDESALLLGVYRLRRPLAAKIIKGLGEAVVVCGTQRDGYFCVARLVALYAAGPDGRLEAKLDGLRYFHRAVPVAENGRSYEALLNGVSESTRRGRLAQSVRELSETEFAAIVAAGGRNDREPEPGPAPELAIEGFAEQQSSFDYATLPDGSEDTVLAYEGRCALTGHSEYGRLHPPSRLEIVPIQPRDAGGEVVVSNLLPLTLRARLAFEAGHLTVGERYELIVALDRIDPELLEALNPLGRMSLPIDLRATPSQSALKYHREHVFNR